MDNESDNEIENQIEKINYDRFEYKKLVDMDLDEYYIEDLYNEITFDCISEILLLIKEYTEERRLPIANKLTFSELYDYLKFFEN